MLELARATPHLPWLAAAFALALVCTPSRDSHAGDDPDQRRELLSALDDKVDDLVDAVEDVAGDSGEPGSAESVGAPSRAASVWYAPPAWE